MRLPMVLSNEKARALLRGHGLRATVPRMRVVSLLAEVAAPMSFTQVVEKLGETEWDPATTYRNLVRLTEAGVTTVVSRAEGMARYALVHDERGNHDHPHFVCTQCGDVSCLPVHVVAHGDAGPWQQAMNQASVQFKGVCPKCETPG